MSTYIPVSRHLRCLVCSRLWRANFGSVPGSTMRRVSHRRTTEEICVGSVIFAWPAQNVLRVLNSCTRSETSFTAWSGTDGLAAARDAFFLLTAESMVSLVVCFTAETNTVWKGETNQPSYVHEPDVSGKCQNVCQEQVVIDEVQSSVFRPQGRQTIWMPSFPDDISCQKIVGCVHAHSVCTACSIKCVWSVQDLHVEKVLASQNNSVQHTAIRSSLELFVQTCPVIGFARPRLVIVIHGMNVENTCLLDIDSDGSCRSQRCLFGWFRR